MVVASSGASNAQVVMDDKLDPYKWPLTLMWLGGKEKDVDHTSGMMQFGVIPWYFDVQMKLENALGIQLPIKRRPK